MYRIALAAFVFTGNAWAHPGHGAAPAHLHEWHYALLAAAMIVAAGIACFRARK